MTPDRAMATLTAELPRLLKLASDHGFARMEQSIQAAIDNAEDDWVDHEYDAIANDRDLMLRQRREA